MNKDKDKDKDKDKILDFSEGPQSLLSNLQLFEYGNIVRVSPLPTSDIVFAISKSIGCNECRKKSLRLIAYEENGPVSSAFCRCLECAKINFLFFSTETLWSPDLLVVMGSSKDGHYLDELQNISCKLCGSTMTISPMLDHDEYDFVSILPLHHSCTNKKCKLKYNIIFWDYPKSYFQAAMNITDEVFEHSEKAGLVFLVAALETYLQKAFMFSSPQNKYLVRKRKVNFQNLKQATEVYKVFMETDLQSVITNSQWELMVTGFKKRHAIIHNAGMDGNFKKIIIDRDFVNQLKSVITEFVEKLNLGLESKCIF